MQEGVTEKAADREGDHDGEGGGVNVGGAEGKEEVCSVLAVQFWGVYLIWRDVLGGPEMYAVASKLFTAGPAGNNTAKTLLMTLDVSGALICFSRFNCCTIGHSYNIHPDQQSLGISSKNLTCNLSSISAIVSPSVFSAVATTEPAMAKSANKLTAVRGRIAKVSFIFPA